MKDKKRNQLMRELATLRPWVAESWDSKAEHNEKIESSVERSGKYYDFFKNSRDALYITDRGGRFIDVNQSFIELFGYTREELGNLKALETYVNHSDRLKFQQEIEQRGLVVDYAVRLRKKDGTELDCLITAMVRRTDEGSVLGYQGIIRDITEYRLMTQKIRENARRYRELADLLPLAVFETDEIGNFFFINRRGFEISGYTPEDIDKGLNALQLSIPEDQDRLIEDMRRTLSGEKLDGREYIGLRKDGSTYPAIIYTNPIIVDQRAVGLRGVILDVTERKSTERQLRIKESAILSSSNAIVMTDLEGNLTYVNPSFLRLWGYDEEEEVLGRPVLEFWENTDEALKVRGEVREKGGWIGELRAKRKDGSGFYAQLSASVVADEIGNPICRMGSIVDISARKEAEEALRESEGRYRTLLDNIDLGIALIDVYHNILMINAAQSRKFNKPASEIIGKKCFREFEKRDAICPHCPGVQTLATGQPAGVETEGVRDDGSRFQVRLKTFPILEQDGKTLGFIETVVDISKRTQAEAALHENKERFRALVEATSDLIWEVDQNGVHTYVSPKIKDLLGFEPEEVIGKTYFDLMPTDEVERVGPLFRDINSAQRPFERLENVYLHKDGRRIVIETSGVPILDAKGTLLGFRGIDRDITERKQAEERLRNYQDRLRSLASELVLAEARERRRVASYLHDDIGHLLAMGKIELGLLQEALPPTHRNGHLDEIKGIIEQVIEHTRSLTVELSPPVLYEMGLVAAVEWLAENISKQYGIRVSVKNTNKFKKLDGNLQILLFQAARELLTNIVKHAQAQKVEIYIRPYKEDKIQIEVKDDGIGFDTSHLLSNMTKNGGFGLFNIRERFNHLGGHCDIQSQPGCGTCVTIVSPLQTVD
jgi:PAS domain S-box-containing protein